MVVAAVTLLYVVTWAHAEDARPRSAPGHDTADTNATEPRPDLRQRLGRLPLREVHGRVEAWHAGRWVSADHYLRLVARGQAQTPRPAWFDWLNVDTPTGLAWVGLGLAGQVLFTGRMLVQWLASERRRRSVVPPVFWWLSLLGAAMLLAYFLWRRDAVGVLGQAAGGAIYARNLWLIHRPAHEPVSAYDVTDNGKP